MPGRGNKLGVWFVGSVILLAVLVCALVAPQRRRANSQASQSLLIYCAANLRVPLEEISAAFQKQTGIRVEAQYAGSQTILTNAQLSGRGDLLLPADDSYIETARQKGMIDAVFPLATMHPVLAVKGGNPKKIHAVEDLLGAEIHIAQANPDAAAIGKVTQPVLEAAGLWKPLAANTRTFFPTVTDVANAVKLGTVDGGIVWDTTVKQTDGLEAVELPVFAATRGRIAIAVLRSSKQASAAGQFARYAAAADGGKKVFERFGYGAAESDRGR